MLHVIHPVVLLQGHHVAPGAPPIGGDARRDLARRLILDSGTLLEHRLVDHARPPHVVGAPDEQQPIARERKDELMVVARVRMAPRRRRDGVDLVLKRGRVEHDAASSLSIITW